MRENIDINQQIDLIINSKRVDLPALNIKPKEIVALISREEQLCPYKIDVEDSNLTKLND